MLKKLSVLGSLAAGLLVFVPTAGATLQLTLSSGATTIVINDNGPGDANGAVGQITYVGAVGNWILNVTTGTALGLGNPLIDLSSADTVLGSGTGANSLTLKFTATNQTIPGSQATSNIGGTLAAGISLNYQGYLDASNTLYGTGTPIGGLQSFGPGGAFSGSVSGAGVSITPYSATEVVTLSGNGTFATSSFDAAIDVVPEPASVLLLGGVLIFATGAIRRKLANRRA